MGKTTVLHSVQQVGYFRLSWWSKRRKGRTRVMVKIFLSAQIISTSLPSTTVKVSLISSELTGLSSVCAIRGFGGQWLGRGRNAMQPTLGLSSVGAISLLLPPHLYLYLPFSLPVKKGRMEAKLECMDVGWANSESPGLRSWFSKLDFNGYFESAYWLKKFHHHWELKYDFECFCTKTMHCAICQNSQESVKSLPMGFVVIDWSWRFKIYSFGCCTRHNSRKKFIIDT